MRLEKFEKCWAQCVRIQQLTGGFLHGAATENKKGRENEFNDCHLNLFRPILTKFEKHVVLTASR
jgi:hypothetical protein